jgi:hypothetical protein
MSEGYPFPSDPELEAIMEAQERLGHLLRREMALPARMIIESNP